MDWLPVAIIGLALAVAVLGMSEPAAGSSRPVRVVQRIGTDRSQDGALTVSVGEVPKVTSLAAPIVFKVRLANAGEKELSGKLVLEVTEGFAVDGAPERPFTLAAKGEQTLDVAVKQAGVVHAAHYALHAIARLGTAKEDAAHAIRVFEIDAKAAAPAWHDKPCKIEPAGKAAATDLALPGPMALPAAVERARAALSAGADARPWTWRLKSEAGEFGAGIFLMSGGLSDAGIAFVSGGQEMSFEGFAISVDGVPLDQSFPAKASFENGVGRIDCPILADGKAVTVRAEVFAEKGALRVRFSMPGAVRNAMGHPRFTDLGLGPADSVARRVYGGFGNVVEGPEDFRLPGEGVHLSTSHVGVEFEKGLALLQASDVFPDAFVVKAAERRYSLRVHHDAAVTLLPSTSGAFAAAHAYKAIAGFKPSPDVAALLGRVCLDQWGGDYLRAASDIDRAGRYGLSDSVFVKHSWQRWGYDVRLPEIYPPSGSMENFQAMVAACRKAGILFCPHDNYVDFYPDAEGFSYRHIIFNPDGTPQKAWFNQGVQAQSYRWLPTAFGPWMEKNLVLVKQGIAPGAYFTDVFTAIAPMDFFNERGEFFPRTVTVASWSAAMDRMREGLGAATMSEAGTDICVGHLASAQSDHGPATRTDNWFGWQAKGADSQRVPWHDMATHGSFILFAGGLSDRYVADEPGGGGYGSDDYNSNTVIGGRAPMCDGPFSRRAVMTYWLLHDVCAELSRGELTRHEFGDDSIHRQHTSFSGGGEVWTNRGATDWTVAGVTLPKFGLLARAGACQAGVVLVNGARVAWASSAGVSFYDARPPLADGVGAKSGSIETRQRRERGEAGPETKLPRQFVNFGPVATDGAFRLIEGEKLLRLIPLPDGPDFRIALDWQKLHRPAVRVARVRALDEQGKELAAPAFEEPENQLKLQVDGKTFEYRIELE